MLTDPSLTLADQISWMVEMFCKIMAPEACKLRVGAVSGTVWNRVVGFGRRFCGLYARWKAGTLPKARVRKKDTSPRPSPHSGEGEGVAACDAARMRPQSLLPRTVGWMRKLLPPSAGTLAGTLSSILLNHLEVQ